MPLPRMAEKDAEVSDTVSREILPDTQAAAKKPSAAKAGPADRQQKAAQAPAAKAIPVPSGTVSREMSMPVPGSDTVMREMSSGAEKPDDLQSLLSGLPTHYEMPKEQIEAIRSGKPYTPSAAGNASSGDTVQREPADQSRQTAGSKQNAPKQKAQGNDSKQAAEAVTRDIVQRESDFVLPKQQKSGASEKSAEREAPKKENKKASSAPKLAGLPQGNFGQNGPAGNSGAFSAPSGGFAGAQASGVVQREMSSATEAKQVLDAAENTPAENVEQKVEAVFPEVTARQLEILADKLVPRIKRIMRTEMERGIFR